MHEERIAVCRAVVTNQVKEGPLKEPLVATVSATEPEQIPKGKSQEENSGGNCQCKKGDFEEVRWWGQTLKRVGEA